MKDEVFGVPLLTRSDVEEMGRSWVTHYYWQNSPSEEADPKKYRAYWGTVEAHHRKLERSGYDRVYQQRPGLIDPTDGVITNPFVIMLLIVLVILLIGLAIFA